MNPEMPRPQPDENASAKQTPPPVPKTAPPIPGDPQKLEQDWVMYTHLSGLASLVSIPAFVGPLVIWMTKKDEYPKVDQAGKEALNFQLTMMLAQLVSIPLCFLFIGFVTLFGAFLMSVIFAIIAAVEASKGNSYRYPMTWRMIQ